MNLLPMLVALLGTCVAAVVSCIPSLHIYNVLACVVLILNLFSPPNTAIHELLFPFFIGMMAGYTMLSTIPSIFVAAPDESAYFTVLPGHKMLMAGRGIHAVVLTAGGSMGAALVVVVILAVSAGNLLPGIQRVLRPHFHWIVWCVMAFMLMSEWPRGGNMGQSGWKRFADSWRSTGMGLVTFALSALLGCIMFQSPPVSPNVAFQNLMPVFTGLFTIPALLLNLACRVEIPRQDVDTSRRADLHSTTPLHMVSGTFAGVLGGGFAAFVPAVTGGVGGMLAGHATALRDDRVFLVSQGASRCVYYVGGLLLLFVPGLHLTRGGAAGMLASLRLPETTADFYTALGCAALAASVSYLLAAPLTSVAVRIIERCGYHRLSAVSLGLILLFVLIFTGLPGILIAAVSTAIGLLPLLYGARRMNCLAVILVPVALNMSGLGPAVAGMLSL